MIRLTVKLIKMLLPRVDFGDIADDTLVTPIRYLYLQDCDYGTSVEEFHINGIPQELECGHRDVAHPIRVVLTGGAVTIKEAKRVGLDLL